MNFVGTQWNLNEVYEIVNLQSYTRYKISKHITWHFNPPSAPHMSRIWKAAVMSTKMLLKIVIRDQILIYEELNTVLQRVEASLKSRLLGSLSLDPNDFTNLIASHFLSIGPLTTTLVPDNKDTPV